MQRIIVFILVTFIGFFHLNEGYVSIVVSQNSLQRSHNTKRQLPINRAPAVCMTREEEEVIDIEAWREERKKKMPGMFNAEGRAYAPWMMDKVLDPAEAKRALEERKIRKASDKNAVKGTLAADPQAMELSGVGLKYTMVGDQVELSWATGDEENNVGFIVSKRAGGTEDWEVIASYKDWAPLNSKGPQGGVYTFRDADSQRGSWVYRVSDCDSRGKKSDLCQALVEVQDVGEQVAVKAFAVGIVVVLGGLVAAGFLLDPLQ